MKYKHIAVKKSTKSGIHKLKYKILMETGEQISHDDLVKILLACVDDLSPNDFEGVGDSSDTAYQHLAVYPDTKDQFIDLLVELKNDSDDRITQDDLVTVLLEKIDHDEALEYFLENFDRVKGVLA